MRITNDMAVFAGFASGVIAASVGVSAADRYTRQQPPELRNWLGGGAIAMGILGTVVAANHSIGLDGDPISRGGAFGISAAIGAGIAGAIAGAVLALRD